ncbi:putative ACR, YggU family [uncultured archaeon]|nr:putative ACR, YggU family [uncultured archaeon]
MSKKSQKHHKAVKDAKRAFALISPGVILGTPMGQIVLQVVPNARVQAIEFVHPVSGMADAPVLKARLPEQAQDGRANLALTRWLSRLAGCPVQIVRGHTSRRKTIAFAPSKEEFLAALHEGMKREQAGR